MTLASSNKAFRLQKTIVLDTNESTVNIKHVALATELARVAPLGTITTARAELIDQLSHNKSPRRPIAKREDLRRWRSIIDIANFTK